MTDKDAVKFFEGYAEAYAAFDAAAIAEHFNLPTVVLSSQDTAVFKNSAQLEENFDQANAHHKTLGFHHANLLDCHIRTRHSDKIVQAEAHWRFERRDGSEIFNFPVDYILCDYGRGWKISATLNPTG